MVLEIRLSNFFSIKDEIVLDLRVGGSKSQPTQRLQANTFAYKDEHLLKSVAIYGANASGKSNIIKAIQLSVQMILQSHLYNENVVFNIAPFKFEDFPKKPSFFLIRFIMNEIEYEYSFSFSRNEIFTEELYYYPNGRRAKVFTRNESAGKEKSEIYSFGSAIRKPLDVAENTSRKTLYISRASQMDREIAKEVFRFFAEKICLGFDFEPLFIEKSFVENKDVVLKALQIADSDIVNVVMEKIKQPHKNINFDLASKQVVEQNVTLDLLNFVTFHKTNQQIPFNFLNEESRGTQILFYTILNVIDVIKNNKLLLIDEIEQSLHSKIVEYIVSLFHAGNSAQIVYTTHNTNLLNLNKLRKDQIYFVIKKDDGSSDLYSLFDYKDFRDTMDVEKAYLQGRFDAIPYIDDSLENLKTIIK
ncbi:MAG: ATP-binding protein [Prevotellaceae bacterium]|jgi:AAA15 family ATPase/GTPase|nr:ATP-binding protein [Prevotellaceae bacterium]